MGYIENRTKEVKEIHSIYNEKISKLIREFAEIPELMRLNTISQSFGKSISAFHPFSYTYTQLDHSIGVAMILDKFIHDDKQIIAGLLHHIASPAFAPAMDLLLENDLEKEPTTYRKYDKIVGSDMLFEYFLKKEISINEVCDDTQYPLVNSKNPRLSADYLEYLLHSAYFTKLCGIEEIQELYRDIVIVPNEENKPEFAFDTPELGERFCRISIEIGKKDRSYESKITMQIIADIVMRMIHRGEITEEDLYKFGDRAILEIGLNSSDKKISNSWKKLLELDKVYTRFTPIEGEYCKKVIMQSKYIDPLVRIKGGYGRASQYLKESKREIEAYLNTDTDLYAYVLDFPIL